MGEREVKLPWALWKLYQWVLQLGVTAVYVPLGKINWEPLFLGWLNQSYEPQVFPTPCKRDCFAQEIQVGPLGFKQHHGDREMALQVAPRPPEQHCLRWSALDLLRACGLSAINPVAQCRACPTKGSGMMLVNLCGMHCDSSWLVGFVKIKWPDTC